MSSMNFLQIKWNATCWFWSSVAKDIKIHLSSFIQIWVLDTYWWHNPATQGNCRLRNIVPFLLWSRCWRQCCLKLISTKSIHRRLCYLLMALQVGADRIGWETLYENDKISQVKKSAAKPLTDIKFKGNKIHRFLVVTNIIPLCRRKSKIIHDNISHASKSQNTPLELMIIYQPIPFFYYYFYGWDKKNLLTMLQALVKTIVCWPIPTHSYFFLQNSC